METPEIFAKGQALPKDWFSGEAFLNLLIARDKNNDFTIGSVSFEAKARTNWHTHPKGQILLVIEGNGYYQEKGKVAQAIKKGDVINIPENIKHWHGASAKNKLVHLAVTNYKDEIQTTWLEAVSDEEYQLVTQNEL